MATPEISPRAPQPERAEPLLPGIPAGPPHLDPAIALGYRTPVQEHGPAADTKAAALLTLSGITLTLLARYAPGAIEAIEQSGWMRLPLYLLFAAFGIFTLATVIQAFRTISPRFPAAPHSLAFFGDIASLSREEYIARVEALSEEEALRQILLYNHTVSTITVEKFRQLRIGIRWFQAAFACWAALIGLAGLYLMLR